MLGGVRSCRLTAEAPDGAHGPRTFPVGPRSLETSASPRSAQQHCTLLRSGMCPEDPVSLAGGLTCSLSVIAAVHPSSPVQLFVTPGPQHTRLFCPDISLEFTQFQAQRVGDAMGNSFKIQWSVEAGSPEGQSAGVLGPTQTTVPRAGADWHGEGRLTPEQPADATALVWGPPQRTGRPGCPLPERNKVAGGPQERTESGPWHSGSSAACAPQEPHLQTGFYPLTLGGSLGRGSANTVDADSLEGAT